MIFWLAGLKPGAYIEPYIERQIEVWLLIADRAGGVHSRGTLCGNIAGKQSHRNQKEGGSKERKYVVGLNAKQ